VQLENRATLVVGILRRRMITEGPVVGTGFRIAGSRVVLRIGMLGNAWTHPLPRGSTDLIAWQSQFLIRPRVIETGM